MLLHLRNSGSFSQLWLNISLEVFRPFVESMLRCFASAQLTIHDTRHFCHVSFYTFVSLSNVGKRKYIKVGKNPDYKTGTNSSLIESSNAKNKGADDVIDNN